ncbi:MAG: 4Fe-4S dicluster domain-containing protein [Thermodesulfobacteriota bacterium]
MIPNLWCRFLCPYGALLGLVALASPLAVHRRPAACIGCGRCDRHCPAGIRVSAKERVTSPECIGCLTCTAVCPAKDCLTVAAPGQRQLPALALPAAVLGIFLLFWAAANLSGHWHTEVPLATLKALYAQDLKGLAHP